MWSLLMPLAFRVTSSSHALSATSAVHCAVPPRLRWQHGFQQMIHTAQGSHVSFISHWLLTEENRPFE